MNSKLAEALGCFVIMAGMSLLIFALWYALTH